MSRARSTATSTSRITAAGASYHCLWDAASKLEIGADSVIATSLPLEDEQWPTEPLFVPRPGDANEDGGWVMSIVYDGLRDRSFLAIWDAERPGVGPIARLWWPIPLPMTFHRIFVPATTEYMRALMLPPLIAPTLPQWTAHTPVPRAGAPKPPKPAKPKGPPAPPKPRSA